MIKKEHLQSPVKNEKDTAALSSSNEITSSVKKEKKWWQLVITAMVTGILCLSLSFAAAGVLTSTFNAYGERLVSMMGSSGGSSTLQKWKYVKAPDFTLTSLNSEVLTLNEMKGKRVVINIWATWCAPCKKEIPHFNQLLKEVPPDELIIVGISREASSVINSFIEKYMTSYPIVSADNLPEPYSAVRTFPVTFFIDRNGIIQNIVTGYCSFDVLKEYALASDYEGEVQLAPASTPSKE